VKLFAVSPNCELYARKVDVNAHEILVWKVEFLNVIPDVFVRVLAVDPLPRNMQLVTLMVDVLVQLNICPVLVSLKLHSKKLRLPLLQVKGIALVEKKPQR